MEHILDKLSTEQLRKLRYAITDVLVKRGADAPSTAPSKKTNDFRYGQNVKFKDRAGKWYGGTVERVNAKTVTVRDTNGNRWRISPHYLELLIT